MILKRPRFAKQVLEKSRRSLLSYLLCTAVFLSLINQPASCETFMQTMDRGRYLEATGDLEGALNAYILAKSMVSNQAADIKADPRLYLARLYAKMGRYSESENEYQTMMSGSSDPQLKVEYGQQLMEQGKFNQSMSVWNEFLAKRPNDPSVLYQMAVCLESTENLDSARDYYQKIVSLAPESSWAAAAQGRMARVGNAVESRVTRQFFPMDTDFGEAGFGWWDLEKMPIHVYIDDGSQVQGFRSSMKQAVYRALDNWKNASGGKINFVVDPTDYQAEAAWKTLTGKNGPDEILASQDPKYLKDPALKSGIHVHWIASMNALGVAMPNFIFMERRKQIKDHIITLVHVWIATNKMFDGSSLPRITAANQAILEKQDRMIDFVATHEFGHALGLPHSTNPGDTMCAGIYAFNSGDIEVAKTLSNGDLASLRQHYNDYVGHGLPPGTKLVTAEKDKDNDAKTETGSKMTASITDSSSRSEEPAAPPKRKVVDAARAAEIKMYDVLYDINSKHYDAGLSKLNLLLTIQPENMQAMYLRGVCNVMLHKFKNAEDDYAAVIKKSPGSDLAKRAQEGLSKIKKAKG